MWTLPNALSCFRIAAMPVQLLLAYHGLRGPFIGLLGLILLTDWADGFLARRRRQVTTLGAQLDSWGDFLTYMSLPVCVWWGWRELVAREAAYVIAGVSFYVLPLLFGFVRFGRLTSYHTWGAKVSAMLFYVSVFALLLGEWSVPLRVSIVVFGVSALEDAAITAILRRWQADVPSAWHAWRLRSAQAARQGQAR